MKTLINLTVPGEPQGKQRPKARIFGKGQKARGMLYTPEKTVQYETFIKELFAIKYPDFEPVEIALTLVLTAGLTIPTSASRIKKQKMEDGEIRPTKKPDNDNVLKAVMDALEGLAYKNDSQIVSAGVDKFYSTKPGLMISIYRTLDED